MGTKYYRNLYEIDDYYRKNKYYKLLLSSLKNDMSKWSETVSIDDTKYQSPDYNGSNFIIEIRLYSKFAYVIHKNPPIKDRNSEIISDDFDSDLKKALQTLRENIFTPEIYDIEKMIGNQHNRKEKLETLEIQQLESIVEDSYQDWLKEPTKQSAQWIAKLMYSYRKKEDYYKIWMEKFGDNELVINELKKLKE